MDRRPGLSCPADRQWVEVGLIGGAAVKGCTRWSCVVEGKVATDRLPCFGAPIERPREQFYYWDYPMELQTHGASKYVNSVLLRSSAGLGWSNLSAELRSHGMSQTQVIVPQHVQLSFTLEGNDSCFVRRTGAGQCQETIATTGTFCLSPARVGDNVVTITAPIARSMHYTCP